MTITVMKRRGRDLEAILSRCGRETEFEVVEDNPDSIVLEMEEEFWPEMEEVFERNGIETERG